MTTSSPESEPHVEHTILANGIRQGHTGGLVLSQLHIGLAVGFAIVACLTAFGGGMIVGMWYKASEQDTSCQYLGDFDAGRAAGPESGDREPATRTAGTGDLLQYAHEQQRGLRTVDAAGDQRPPGSAKGAGALSPCCWDDKWRESGLGWIDAGTRRGQRWRSGQYKSCDGLESHAVGSGHDADCGGE